MILLLTTFCIGVTFDTTRLLGIVVLAMTTYILPWLLIPLIGALGGCYGSVNHFHSRDWI